MKFAKDQKKSCSQCSEHRAMFRFKGRVRRDADHTMCFECFRSLCDSTSARRMADQKQLNILRYEESHAFFRQSLEQPAVSRVRP